MAGIVGVAGYATITVVSGRWTVTPILSGSMTPGLPVGGVAVAQRVPTHSLALRDVIVFQNPNRRSVQVVHRIIKVDHDGSGRTVVSTQGDANTAADPWTLTLPETNIYVVRFTIPLLGYPAVFTNHGIDMVAGGAVLLAVAATTLLARERRRTRDTDIDLERPAKRDGRQSTLGDDLTRGTSSRMDPRGRRPDPV